MRNEAGYQASSDLATEIIKYVKQHNKQPTNQDLAHIIPQKQRYKLLIEPFANTEMRNFSKLYLACCFDYASKSGRALWRLLPSSEKYYLDDTAMTLTMRQRLLVPSATTATCTHCSKPYTFLHEEVCSNKYQSFATRKHDKIVNMLKPIFATPGTRVLPAPITTIQTATGTKHLQADLSIKGERAFNRVGCIVDVSVVSFASQDAYSIMQRINYTENETPMELGKRIVSLICQHREKDKMQKYKNAYEEPFVPLVLCPNGTVKSAMLKWINSPNFIYDISALCAMNRAPN